MCERTLAERTARSKRMRLMVSRFEVGPPRNRFGECDGRNHAPAGVGGLKSFPGNFHGVTHAPQPLELYALDATEVGWQFQYGNVFCHFCV